MSKHQRAGLAVILILQPALTNQLAHDQAVKYLLYVALAIAAAWLFIAD